MSRYNVFYLDKRNVLFWFVQFLIWTSYFIYSYVITMDVHTTRYITKHFHFHTSLYLFFMCYFGVPLSLLLKFIYDRFRKRFRSVSLIIVIVISSSFVLANLWFVEILVLDKIVANLGYAITQYDFSYYIWEVYSAMGLLITWSVLYLLTEYWHESGIQKNKAENALFLAENAQLKMLRYQLNPHFLFNSLGSLRSLIRDNSKRAEKMLTEITEFLRYSLTVKSEMEVPLSEEIAAIKHYLNIEKARFGDKLNVLLNIDELAEYYPVPIFILHPLVENAVKYGMQSNKNEILVEISAKINNETLTVYIENTGDWIDKNNQQGTNTGIENVKNRLIAYYKNECKLEIEKLKNSVRVKLVIKKSIPKNETII